MVDLVCVDPNRVHEVWPHARELIKKAIERTNLSAFEDVEYDVLSGDQLLWLAWSGKIEAAATTHLARNICTMTACSGENRKRWQHLFEKIEKYAKDEGCDLVRIYGRKGWSRLLNSYRVKHVVLERAL